MFLAGSGASENTSAPSTPNSSDLICPAADLLVRATALQLGEVLLACLRDQIIKSLQPLKTDLVGYL